MLLRSGLQLLLLTSWDWGPLLLRCSLDAVFGHFWRTCSWISSHSPAGSTWLHLLKFTWWCNCWLDQKLYITLWSVILFCTSNVLDFCHVLAI